MVERSLIDGEVSGLSPSSAANFLKQEFKPSLLLSTQVYKWAPVRNISRDCFHSGEYSIGSISAVEVGIQEY